MNFGPAYKCRSAYTNTLPAGYMVARMLGMAPTLADAVIDQLALKSDKAEAAGAPPGAQSEEEANALSAAVWSAIWPVQR